MSDDGAPMEQWFVRFAGQRTGPYDVERLRTLARRGAITSLHFLSVDGASWASATSVRAVFNADGSVASNSARAPRAEGASELGLAPEDGRTAVPEARAAEVLPAAVAPDPRDTPVVALPGRRRQDAAAALRPVAIGALFLAALALACSALPELPAAPRWMSAEDLAGRWRLSVRMLQGFAVIGGAVLLSLRHDPQRSTAAGAVAAVVACASATDAHSLPWACSSLIVLAAAAPMLAFVGSHGGTAFTFAAFVALSAPLAAAVSMVTASRADGRPWLVLASLASAGCLAIGAGGAAALGWMPRRSGHPFVPAGIGSLLIAVSSVIPSLLARGEPGHREVAVDAACTLAFAGACWAALSAGRPSPAFGRP